MILAKGLVTAMCRHATGNLFLSVMGAAGRRTSQYVEIRSLRKAGFL